METTKTLWTVRDVATFLKTPPNRVYNLVERDLIPYYRLGRQIRFDPDAVRRWLDDKHNGPRA